MYGNGRAEVLCIDSMTDSTTRILIIRKKFKGRSRRDNNLEVGTWVLAGVRLWEVIKEGAKETCDLLEVYNNNDIETIKETVNLPWTLFKNIGKIDTMNDNIKDDNIDFKNMGEAITLEDISENSDSELNSNNSSEVDIDDI